MAARTRTHVIPVGAMLAGLVLTGCANAAVLDRTAAPEDSLARIQGVAAKLAEARSARFSMTQTQRRISAGQRPTVATAVGVYDYAAHQGQRDTTINTAALPFPITQRTLVIGSAVYTKTMPQPPKSPKAPDGVAPAPAGHYKPWSKLELPRESADHHGFGSGFGPGPGPTEALQYLRAASGKVDVIGEEPVRGVRCTRYAVTLDMAKEVAQLPEELRPFFGKFAKPADVWIDRQGRLRRIHYVVTMNEPRAQVTIESTLELYDFGIKVRVVAPAANQVEPASQLAATVRLGPPAG